MPNAFYPTKIDLATNGSQTSWTLPTKPAAGSELVLLNGLVQHDPGDYTLVGAVLTLSIAPGSSDQLSVYYTSATAQQGIAGGTGTVPFDAEAIANALFILLGQVNFSFVAMDRRGAIWSNVPPANQPYLALIGRDGQGVQNQAPGLEKWTLQFLVLVYIRADAVANSVPDTELNNIFTAIKNVLYSVPLGEKQTLGGLCNNVWISAYAKDTGILDQQCSLLISISVDCGL